MFTNAPSTDPIECSVRSREGASIEFEMTVTDNVSSPSISSWLYNFSGLTFFKHVFAFEGNLSVIRLYAIL